MTDHAADIVAGIGDARHELHRGHASSRPLSDGYETIGLQGELAFSQFCGLAADLAPRPGGDKGVDFVVPLLFTVDVKTARKAFNLIHEAGKPFCDIYVLAQCEDPRRPATLLGWEYGHRLAKAPTREFGHGIVNHYIALADLRPMAELTRRVMRIRGQE